MKYRKFNKYEAKEERSKLLTQQMGGSGLYLYRNSTDSEMTLPRPTKSGLRFVGPKGTFQGDSYYMQYVKQGLLRLVEVLQTPEQEAAVRVAEAQQLNEGNMITEDKLILDQPDIVTEHGKVEHVAATTPPQKLNEKCGEQGEDVLLNECPCDDGFVIVDDK